VPAVIAGGVFGDPSGVEIVELLALKRASVNFMVKKKCGVMKKKIYSKSLFYLCLYLLANGIDLD